MNKSAEENVEITPDFVIEVFNKAKSAKNKSEQQAIEAMAELLSEHIGETLE